MHEKTRTALETLDTKEILILEDAEAGCLSITKHGPFYEVQGYDLTQPDDSWEYLSNTFEGVVEVLDRHHRVLDALEAL